MSELRWADKMLIYENGVCQYFGRKYPACAKCVEVCPNDALKAGDETIEIDTQKCTQCGDCVSICPSGAISQKAEFVDTADILKNSEATVVFCEKKAWTELSSEVTENVKPVLLEHTGVLGESDFVQVLSLAGGPVVLLGLEEDDKVRPFVKAAEFVGAITRKVFGQELVFVFTEKQKFLDRLKDIVSIAPCAGLRVDIDSQQFSKREAFNAIVGQWIKKTADLQEVVFDHPAYATIKCDKERCILCGACANQCRLKALSMTDGNRELTLVPARCMNCGVCVELCPEKALSCEGGFSLNESFFNKSRLARTEAVKCSSCGREFTSAKRAAKVASKLKQARGEDLIRDELLGLCPDCRTKKAFTDYSGWSEKK